jgi:2-oxoglutarate ferredoxin oxidoreductase subunit beta
MTVIDKPAKLTAKDYASDQEVRWCPGCGDYAILKGVQKTLADLAADPAKTVFISGIGCAARFPYYMATYGFHTIHGRAPAIATGIKLANPELDVWVVSGDGDALSIGGNHLLHVLRRNVDLQILLFNNEIYGLTKGQYSPTSRVGTRSPSTPAGSLDYPISAAQLALGAGARFVARAVDTQQKRLPVVLQRAHAHRGASLVEILQNCIVYNDGVFDEFTAREVADDRQIHVEHGQPLRFGKDGGRGLRLARGGLALEAVTLGEDGITEGDLLVHDETDRALAGLLAAMEPPRLPVALGVLYCDPRPSYDSMAAAQSAAAASATTPDLNALMRRGHTWEVAVEQGASPAIPGRG